MKWYTPPSQLGPGRVGGADYLYPCRVPMLNKSVWGREGMAWQPLRHWLLFFLLSGPWAVSFCESPVNNKPRLLTLTWSAAKHGKKSGRTHIVHMWLCASLGTFCLAKDFWPKKQTTVENTPKCRIEPFLKQPCNVHHCKRVTTHKTACKRKICRP